MKTIILAAIVAITTLSISARAASPEAAKCECKKCNCTKCDGACAAKDSKPAEKADTPKATTKPYPLTTCIVSGDKLGEMGKPVVFTHDGQEIKLCCNDCRGEFDKDPAKHLKKLSAGK